MTHRILPAVLGLVLVTPIAALADPLIPPAAAASSLSRSSAGPIAAGAIRHAATHDLALRQLGYSATPSRRGRVARKVVGAIAGGVGGFFLGGVVGAKLEPSCGCDDPGLKGFLIGAPIGAAAGAVLGSMVD